MNHNPSAAHHMTARFAAFGCLIKIQETSQQAWHYIHWNGYQFTCLICLPLFMQYNEEIGICHKNTAGLITSIKVKLFIS